MKQYLDLLQHIYDNGVVRQDRTGVGTKGVFGYQMRFDLHDGFPLVTTKKLHTRSIVHELLWMLRGETNVNQLHGVTIWDEWADGNGELGPVYGAQWRSWNGHIDQITQVIHSLKTNPYSRRHIVSAWNVEDIDDMALPPCHVLFQFYIVDNKLSCQLYQRSADVFLGLPFNIASYSLLTMMVAKVIGRDVGEFIHTLGDAHLYLNHIHQAELQLSRKPHPLPTLTIPYKQSVFDYTYSDIMISNYIYHPTIPAEVAI